MVWVSVATVALLAAGLTALAVGGSGHAGEPPPTTHGGHGSKLPVSRPPSTRGVPVPTRPVVCSTATVPLANRSQRASASLLPCDDAPSLRGIATYPHAP